MGSGIALVSAIAGLEIVINDVNESALQRGIKGTASNLERMVSKGKISADKAEAALRRIKGSVAACDFGQCDLVIEAATENIRVKEEILRHLDSVVSPSTMIATNTSSVSVTRLGAALGNPGRFIGMHFFNPVPVMSLVELIRGVQTSDATFDAAVRFARRVGKTPIAVKNAPGFVVNRILVPMINEAIFVLQEGLASAEEIDVGMNLGANHPLGPLALADLIGLDTLLAIMEVLHREFGDSKYRPAPMLREMVEAKYLGRKSGQGFFAY